MRRWIRKLVRRTLGARPTRNAHLSGHRRRPAWREIQRRSNEPHGGLGAMVRPLSAAARSLSRGGRELTTKGRELSVVIRRPITVVRRLSAPRGVLSLATGWVSAAVARFSWLARVRPEAGMSTAEYAVGTIAACAFAGLLFKIVSSPEVRKMLSDLISRALKLAG
jgi:hypothetical protein